MITLSVIYIYMYVYREIYIFDYLTYIHGKKVYICRGGGRGGYDRLGFKKVIEFKFIESYFGSLYN